MLENMLDLDCRVVGHIREFGIERTDNVCRMRRAIEKIRIAERDVPGPCCYLLPDIVQHCLPLNYTEMSVIHRNNGTMPAKMLAASARFCIGDHPCIAARVKFRIPG